MVDQYTTIYLDDISVTFSSGTSSFVIIASSSGDIYNIGGISGESTTNIVFTLWDNRGYGRGRSR
jgi:hypothetical protein